MAKLAILMVVAFSVASGSAFWTGCPHTAAPGPDSITSPNCDAVRCTAVRGEIVTADILATPRGAHVELRTRITAFIFGIGVPLPVDPPFDDACNELFVNGQLASCPTVPHRQYQIRVEIPILMVYPTFSNTIVRVEFLDRGEIAACGQVLADIV